MTGLADGRVVAWEATSVPREILSLEAHRNGVTALSFPRQVLAPLMLYTDVDSAEDISDLDLFFWGGGGRGRFNKS